MDNNISKFCQICFNKKSQKTTISREITRSNQRQSFVCLFHVYFLFQHPFFQGNLTASIARDLLDRLNNGATSNQISEDRDDDDDDRVCELYFLNIIEINFLSFQSNRHVPRKITSNKEQSILSSSSRIFSSINTNFHLFEIQMFVQSQQISINHH